MTVVRPRGRSLLWAMADHLRTRCKLQVRLRSALASGFAHARRVRRLLNSQAKRRYQRKSSCHPPLRCESARVSEPGPPHDDIWKPSPPFATLPPWTRRQSPPCNCGQAMAEEQSYTIPWDTIALAEERAALCSSLPFFHKQPFNPVAGVPPRWDRYIARQSRGNRPIY